MTVAQQICTITPSNKHSLRQSNYRSVINRTYCASSVTVPRASLSHCHSDMIKLSRYIAMYLSVEESVHHSVTCCDTMC